MTAKTHVLGSMSLALGGYILMDKGGLLIVVEFWQSSICYKQERSFKCLK